MIYQFLDWRVGRGRAMFGLDVETLLTRLRAANGNVLPMYLETWELVQVFAGTAKIALPEMEVVARGLVASAAYPTLAWVHNQYEKFLLYMANSDNNELLKDPEPVTLVTDIVQLTFNTVLEGSVSNTEEVELCSVPVPATSSPTSTLVGLPNSLSMGKRQFPRALLPSTPTSVPSLLSALRKGV